MNLTILKVLLSNSKIARNRAKLSGRATNVLESRTLMSSHRRLADQLTGGLTVLDVGCGTGTITRGIAEAVGPKGRVVGVDSNPVLIDRALQLYGDIPWLTFEVGDIYHLNYKDEFDIVTSARVLQWLPNPETALYMMKSATKLGGQILVLDYNHEKIEWSPDPPSSMRHFYAAFLKWRSDAGMSNTIADELPKLFKKIGIKEIIVTPQHEKVTITDKDFQKKVCIWEDVVASRGLQMVKDGYITEKERVTAKKDYQLWIKNNAKSQMMYLLAVEGVKMDEKD